MEQLKVYDGNSITFQMGNGDVMVNATEMLKSFPDKKMNNFLRTEQTEAFISILESKTLKSVLIVNHGGSNPGTWMHQKLALKFAAWLSPEFELWVYDRIEELVKEGYTKLDSISRKELAMLLIQSEEEKERLQAEKESLAITAAKQAEVLKSVAPKVEYHDKVMSSGSLITTTEIANELGFTSAKAMNQFLKSHGIIRWGNNTWALKADFSGKGYAKYKPHPYVDHNGQTQTSHHLYWTEEGRKFLHQCVNELKKTA